MPDPEGTPQHPWVLNTPPLTSTFQAWLDTVGDVDVVVVKVGTTVLHYQRRCLDDLAAMLTERGDWMELGSADEQKEARPATVEAWARSADNPVGGWYGLKKGLRGRFAMYIPPLLEELGRAEVEHQPRNNTMRALLGVSRNPVCHARMCPARVLARRTTKPILDVSARRTTRTRLR